MLSHNQVVMTNYTDIFDNNFLIYGNVLLLNVQHDYGVARSLMNIHGWAVVVIVFTSKLLSYGGT